jgi:hypothetical protein
MGTSIAALAAGRTGEGPIGYDPYEARDHFPMVKLRVALLTLVVAISTSVGAQEWPSRAIRFSVPFPAGGSTDVGARLVGESLSRSFRQQIVVESGSAQAFAQLVHGDFETYGRLVKALSIRSD